MKTSREVGEFFNLCFVRLRNSPIARAILKMLSGSFRTAAISLRLDLSQPQQTDSHDGDDRLCLYGLYAKYWGRLRSSVLFC